MLRSMKDLILLIGEFGLFGFLLICNSNLTPVIFFPSCIYCGVTFNSSVFKNFPEMKRSETRIKTNYAQPSGIHPSCPGGIEHPPRSSGKIRRFSPFQWSQSEIMHAAQQFFRNLHIIRMKPFSQMFRPFFPSRY